ncbi:hypothetical protein [Polaribacter sp. M15]
MRKNALKFLVLTLIGIIIYSCQNENDFTTQVEESINLNEQDGLKKMILGKKLENPYSVENMKKALNNLKQSKLYAKRKGTSEILEITTTHLYIRFKPVNEEELNLIERDTTLILFDHPMDYEISEEGDFYQDPEIPDELPTYQYTSVEVDKELPNVPYEILANLYIPYDENEDNDIEDENTLSKSTSQLNEKNILGILEEEALRITGNLEKEENSTTLQRCWFCRPSKWQPKGKITLWDTTLGRYIGVEGVKVRAGRWFKWRTAITKADGSYAFAARFRRSVRYKMDWERYDFALRSGFWASAQYRGPYKKGDWNWQIRNGDRHQYYGTIFRAAHHYYYKDIKGLRRPPKNTFWKSQTRIRASRKQDAGKLGSHLGVRRVWGLGDGIYIYTFGRSSSQTYATTIHELAHASHWNFQRVNHNVSKLILAESWARGVQWELTRMVYPSYEPQYSTLGYTGFVQDLIDRPGIRKSTNLYYDKDEGKTLRRPTGFKSYTDNVSGFTIRQLEDALKGINTFNGWRNQIKSMNPNNPTKENIDETYNFCNNQ